jgi:hypothetical protein
MNCQVAQKLQVPPPNTLGPAILEYQSNAGKPAVAGALLHAMT